MIATTPEQSKELIELGIDINTADMHYYSTKDDPTPIIYPKFSNVTYDLFKRTLISYIPAWSLNSLLKLIPIEFKIEKTLFDQSDMFTYSIICDEYRTYEHEELINATVEFILKTYEESWK